MRWEALFADLEAEFESGQAAELAAEVADRTRREVARVRLLDRLRASKDAPITAYLPAGLTATGTLSSVGPDWFLLREAVDGVAGREILVVLAAVQSLGGLGGRSVSTAPTALAARLDLRYALRGLARARVPVRLLLRDGSAVSGTLDGVGSDYLDLAEHEPGQPRRPAAVRGVRTVPLAALAAVRTGS